MRIWDVLSQKKCRRNILFSNDGFCHVHKSIHAEDVKKAKELHPEAVVLAHPECTGDVLELADFVEVPPRLLIMRRIRMRKSS